MANEEESAPQRREGLPPAFRMRHGPHYVEQVMGEAPLRTVREVPVSEIDVPAEDDVDDVNVEELQQSIREVGVLEPLLVTLQDDHYQVISGAKRLRAALAAGLRTVPCLIHDVDRGMVPSLREAARRRAEAPPREPMPSASVPDDVTTAPAPETAAVPAASGDVAVGLSFVSALVPALESAGDDPLRCAVISDLIAAELQRAKTIASATEILAHPRTLAREDMESGVLVNRVLDAVRPEARLRGVHVDSDIVDPAYRMSGDVQMVTSALTGLVHSLMLLIWNMGSLIRLSVKGTTVRPALIVGVTQDSVSLDNTATSRFFDDRWTQHPCGASGALMLAAAARVARLHGGRADIAPASPKGWTVTFVVPRPCTGEQR